MRLTSRLRRVDRATMRLAAWLLLAAAGTPAAAAQEPATSDVPRAYATRSALEAQALAAERASAEASSPTLKEFHRADAWLLRRRLAEGDFTVGDRVVLVVKNEPTLTDTFTVRTGLLLEFSKLPPISLQGVLRSELETHLRTELSRYYREPVVSALPLVRVAVMGQVGRPGYYHVPADMLLTDLLMSAGGPNTNADLKRSEIRRGDGDLYTSRDVRIALADGMSLDALNLRSGDEFHLSERRNMSWTSVFRIVTITSGIVSLILSLTS